VCVVLLIVLVLIPILIDLIVLDVHSICFVQGYLLVPLSLGVLLS